MLLTKRELFQVVTLMTVSALTQKEVRKSSKPVMPSKMENGTAADMILLCHNWSTVKTYLLLWIRLWNTKNPQDNYIFRVLSFDFSYGVGKHCIGKVLLFVSVWNPFKSKALSIKSRHSLTIPFIAIHISAVFTGRWKYKYTERGKGYNHIYSRKNPPFWSCTIPPALLLI